MTRVLILLGVLALALVVLWAVAGGGGSAGDDLAGDAETPLPYERDAPRPGGARPAGDAPALQADGRAAERRAAREAQRKALEAAKGATGPYELTFIAWQTDAPLEGVEVRSDEPESRLLGRSGDDGVFELADGGDTRLAFRASLAGHLTHRGVAFPDKPQEIVLHAGVTIEGTVLRAGPDTPIPEASVRVWDVDLDREVVSTTTDEQGRFRLRAVRPNHPVEIVVTAKGLVPHHHVHAFEGPEETYDITVGGGGHVRGRVIDAAGKALPGLEVRLLLGDEPLFERRAAADPQRKPEPEPSRRGSDDEITRARTAVTHTDEEGRYAFDGAPLEVSLRATALVGPRLRASADPALLRKDGDILERDIRVERPAALRIRIHDGLGNVLSHAQVRVTRHKAFVPLLSSDRWEDGALLVEGLTPGEVYVRAELPGMPHQGTSAKLVAGSTTDVELILPPGGELVGEVRDKRGEPIWQAHVTFRAARPREHVAVRTDERGRFRLRGLQAEEGTLSVTARDLPYTRWGYEGEIREHISPGEGRQVFTLKDGTRVTGTFRDLPADADVRSTMTVNLNGRPKGFTPLPLDGQGRFARPGPEPRGGTVWFVFRTRRFAPLFVRESDPFQSEEVRDLGALRFEATNPREGQVLGAGNKPLRGAKVSVAASWSTKATRTDAKGHFVFARLPDEDVFLRIEADGYPQARVTLGTGSQYLRQVVRLRKGREVRVRVLDQRGRPATRAQAWLRGRGSRKTTAPEPVNERVRTLPGGVITRYLPYGTYDVWAWDVVTRHNGTLHFEVKPDGRPAEVTLKLGPRKR